MSVLRQLYGQPLALLTDLYQLTMAYAHWRRADPQREAVFHLVFRQPPFGGGPVLACGLDAVIEYLADLRFTEDDLGYLAAQRGADGKPIFEHEFLAWLGNLRFTGNLDALPEGTAVFPHAPLLRVQAPVLQAQLLETALLNLIGFPTLVATKGARMAYAAGDDPVLDFGLRKAHGPGAGVLAARAAYIGGCAATANVLAGKLFGIPVKGTHAHSWVMAFDDELDAFRRYAEALPDNCVFLVDTYDSLSGIENAIEVGLWLRQRGHEMLGIRLDSGDLGALAMTARRRLDAAGFPDAAIAASSSLDEHAIAKLRAAGAPIVLWGVGTRLTTGQPDAALDAVYKLGAIRDRHGRWRYRIKLSDTADKASHPGIRQLRRYFDDGGPLADWIYDDGALGADFTAARDSAGNAVSAPEGAGYRDLLVPVFRAGRCVYRSPSLSAIRDYGMREYRQFVGRHDYPVLFEQRLVDEHKRLHSRLRCE